MFATSYVHASKFRTSSTLNHRRGQSVCSAPPVDCGFGLWNEDSCECSCIPPYCFDDVFQSCVTAGSCPDPFEGCAPGVNCPYFPNPSTGLCESGPTITQGVFEVFRTEQECCMASYPDPSSCILVPPTASPSLLLAPVATLVLQTTEPQTTEPQEDEPQTLSPSTDTEVLLEPIPILFSRLPSQFELNDDRRGKMMGIIQNALLATSDDFNITISEIGIVDAIFSDQAQMLPLELYITVIGISRNVMGRNIATAKIRAAFLDALQYQVDEIDDGLRGAWGPETYPNNAILSIGDFHSTSKTESIGGSAPTLRPSLSYGVVATPTNPNNEYGGKKSSPIWAVVLIAVLLFALMCGGIFVCRRRRDNNMDGQPPNEQGPSSNASLSLSPSVEHALANRPPGKILVDMSFNRSHHTNTTFNQSRERSMDKSLTVSRLMNPSSNQLQPMNQSSNQSRHSHMSLSSKSHRMDQSVNGQSTNRERHTRERGAEWSSNESSRMNQSSNQSFRTDQSSSSNQSRRRMDRKDENINRIQLDPPEEIADQRWNHIDQNPYQHHNLHQYQNPYQLALQPGNQGQISPEDDLDEGYEGGKSSFFISKTNVSEDEDSSDQDEGVEADESEDNVLGLLYYVDASSAEESGAEAKESGKSRRSRRTRRSRNSSRKSSKPNSSRSQKSRRKKVPNRILEESEYQHQQQRHRDLEEMPRNIVGEPERQNAHETNPITGVNHYLNGSTVYINTASSQDSLTREHELIATRHAEPRGDNSAFSHGSTIRTDDNHRKAYAHNDMSRRNNHGMDLDSLG